ncbi:MAG: hypothetical protein KF755_00215 [Burkholderiaceae bacterium]|jgi:hypothetical protein|nr:hypothetical protein [Burkholderiaceae bacterium]
MDTTQNPPRQRTAAAGRYAGCIDVSTRFRRGIDRLPTRGRRSIGADVIEVTREHWLAKPVAGVALVRIADEAQPARIGPASAPIAA